MKRQPVQERVVDQLGKVLNDALNDWEGWGGVEDFEIDTVLVRDGDLVFQGKRNDKQRELVFVPKSWRKRARS